MRASQSIVDLAERASRAWFNATREDRRDALETFALSHPVFLGHGAEDLELWAYPRSVSQRIVLDHSCREEALRRNYQPGSPIELAVAQAKSLVGFREQLAAELESIEDWDAVLAAVRIKGSGAPGEN